ncbi:MAG: hypothetical protein JWQ11_3801, partial [Rhizobacter sp.]|nr:hypothetical protein [Rhizobacter sp.]
MFVARSVDTLVPSMWESDTAPLTIHPGSFHVDWQNG